MYTTKFVQTCRQAQKDGVGVVFGVLHAPYRGVKHIAIRNLNSSHDLWIQSRSGKTTIGHAYLGSKKTPIHLEGWPERIVMLWTTT